MAHIHLQKTATLLLTSVILSEQSCWYYFQMLCPCCTCLRHAEHARDSTTLLVCREGPYKQQCWVHCSSSSWLKTVLVRLPTWANASLCQLLPGMAWQYHQGRHPTVR